MLHGFVSLVLTTLLLVPAAMAQSPDRMPQMTVIVSDAAALLSEIVTCNPNGSVQGPRHRRTVEEALVASGLQRQQADELVRMLDEPKQLIKDDETIAAALAFCDSRGADRTKYRRYFDLPRRIAAAAAEPAGRDDARVMEVIERLAVERGELEVCVRLYVGPIRKREGFDPSGNLAKQLARFDISPPVREHIERLLARNPDFSAFRTVGELRGFCKAQRDALVKREVPPSTFRELTELEPAR
jgi:hypothetical protein